MSTQGFFFAGRGGVCVPGYMKEFNEKAREVKPQGD